MRGLPAVAGQRAYSMGTLLIAAGGLALYQMTSLVLGPGGSRELQLSLAIPAADGDDLSDAARPSGNQMLGSAFVVAAAPSATPSAQARPRPAQPRASAAPAPVSIVATSTATPVPSEPASKCGQGHPKPPKHHDTN